MVSFNCAVCQDVVKKPKVATHAAGCGGRNARFTCVDCLKCFDLNSIKDHTSCISETDKYQKQWKGPVKKEKLDTSDEEEEEEKRRQEAASGKKVPVRRPRMNFSDSSDDEAAGSTVKKHPAKAAAAVVVSEPVKKSKVSAAPAAAVAAVPSPKQKPVSAPAAHNNGAAKGASAVSVTFTVAASGAEFQQMVQHELASRWNKGDEVSAKAVAKVLAETLAQSKEFKASLQNLIAEKLGEKVNVE